MTPWVKRLIFANVIMYLICIKVPGVTESLMLVPALALVRPWTLVTYMFLHAGMGHIFFNMLGLFFFGPRLEVELGGKQFLLLYFVSGIVGAALSFVFTPYTAIVGASGALYGVMFGFAYFWPRERLYIWGIFPVEARLLVIIMTALSLFGGIGGSSDGIAHFAHLGGFIGGYFYLRLFHRKYDSLKIEKTPAILPPSNADMERWGKIPRERLHEVNREELDRILLKIKTTGVQSLTLIERTFLDRFSNM